LAEFKQSGCEVYQCEHCMKQSLTDEHTKILSINKKNNKLYWKECDKVSCVVHY